MLYEVVHPETVTTEATRTVLTSRWCPAPVLAGWMLVAQLQGYISFRIYNTSDLGGAHEVMGRRS